MIRMERIYESLMEGLMEDLQDIQLYGDPQGRRTVIEPVAVIISEKVQRTGRISKGSCSFFMFRDASN